MISLAKTSNRTKLYLISLIKMRMKIVYLVMVSNDLSFFSWVKKKIKYILCCIEFVIIGRRHCTFLAHLVNIHDILHSRIGVYIIRWITCGFCLYFFLQLSLVKLQRRRQVTTKTYKQWHLTFYSCHISLDIINEVLWFLPFNDLRYDNHQCICFCFVLQTVYDVLHANFTKAGSIKFT